MAVVQNGNNGMRNVIVKIVESDLNADGRWFLDIIRHQNNHLASLLQSRNGLIYAEINDEDVDDILYVTVDDTLNYTERARRFSGVEVGSVEDSTVQARERMFGMYAMTVVVRQRWLIPDPLIRRARQNPIDGAAIINAAADALRRWCAEGGFVVWRNPDWISQTEAASVAGVPLHTIRNAVRDGRISTWDDPDEPNPQRQTRVRRSEVLKRWPVH